MKKSARLFFIKTTSITVFLILLTIFSNWKTEAQLPMIKVGGNKFVTESGETIVFKGIDFSDPDKLEKDGHWNAAYFQMVKNWGANVVRFAVHPTAWRSRGQEDNLKLIDKGVQWAADLEMYVIIDWHSIGNLRSEMFQAPMYETTKKETFEFWRTISKTYRGNSTVAFYEIFNEPTVFNGQLGIMSWNQWKGIAEEIITIIYAHNPDAIPLVGGLNWAYDLTPVKTYPVELPGIAYVTHPYPQKREQPWETKWEKDWGFVADTYPVFATEFGFMSADDKGAHIPVISDEEYGQRIMNYLTEKGISWSVWCFDPDWSPQLISDWNFTPTRQGKFFFPKSVGKE